MASKKGGAFVGLILFHMRAADYSYQRGDAYAAVAHLMSAGNLVKAKIPQRPITRFNPYFSPSAQNAYALHYVKILPSISMAVREFIDRNRDDTLGLDEGDDE